MEFIFILFIVWVFVLLIGHGSWLILRTIFRALFGASGIDHEPYPDWPDRFSDIEATRRVVRQMESLELVSKESASEFRMQLRQFEHGETNPSPSTTVPTEPTIDLISSEVTPSVLPAPFDYSQPITATIVSEPDGAPVQASSLPVQSPPDNVESTGPVLSRAEIIQSFLAAHNIRWGELVAGMLIVICSIGLVISLWNPLVETHKVIPSLIFLGANAAIYAAGLYTLSRWRLRHTSRAVLVIATLLIPLSVVAGLAAAGTDASAVRLNDPVTLAAIAVAGFVYSLLLFQGGRALTRRHFALPITIAVAGPVTVLPFVPGAVRSFQMQAGWIVGIGSLGVMLAAMLIPRLRNIGNAGGRVRLLVVAFSGFAMAVSVAYSAFALRQYNWLAMLPIAIATIPAWVALAAVSRELMASARNPTQSLVGAVLLTVLIGISCAILPVAMVSQGWLWAWGTVFTLCVTIAGFVFRQPRWMAFASLPVGVSAVTSAPLWMGGKTWEQLRFWDRVISGESMLTAAGAAIAVGLLAQAIKDPHRHWTRVGAGIWALFSLLIATALSIATPSMLGIAPSWSVTLVLAFGVFVAVFASTQKRVGIFGTGAAVVGILAFWGSVFRPFVWGQSLLMTPASDWFWTLGLTNISLLLLCELIPWTSIRYLAGNRPATRTATKLWMKVSVGLATVSFVVACWFASQVWTASAITLAVATCTFLWASTISKQKSQLRLAQFASIMMLVVIGYGRYESMLFTSAAWQSSLAIWSWAVIAATVGLLWLAIREVVTIDRRFIRKRFAYLKSNEANSMAMADGWSLALSVLLLMIGTGWRFLSLNGQVVSEMVVASINWMVPAVAIASCSIAVLWSRRQEGQHPLAGNLCIALTPVCMVWAATQLGQAVTRDVVSQLVVTTSTVASIGIGMLVWRRQQRFLRYVPATIVGVVSIASLALLEASWFTPIANGLLADRLATVSLAAWWALIAGALFWHAKRELSSTSAIGSALVSPLVAVVSVPAFLISSPILWTQVAAIASLIWASAAMVVIRRHADSADAFRSAIQGSRLFATGAAVSTCILVAIRIVINEPALNAFANPAGFLLSLMVLLWVCLRHDETNQAWRPIGVSLFAGQLAWLGFMLIPNLGVHGIEMIGVIWLVGATWSLIRHRRQTSGLDGSHVAFVAVQLVCVQSMVGPRSELLPWLALIATGLAGIWVGLQERMEQRTMFHSSGSRLLGWFVILAGSYVIVQQASSLTDLVVWTLLVVWTAVWLIAWRLIAVVGVPSRKVTRWQHAATPDHEFSTVLLLAVLGETLFFALTGHDDIQLDLQDSMLWTRAVSFLCVGVFSFIGRRVILSLGIGTIVATGSLIAVHVGTSFWADVYQRFVVAFMSASFLMAFVSHWLPQLNLGVSRITHVSNSNSFAGLVQAVWQVAILIGAGAAVCSGAMISAGAPPAETNLLIASVALIAWTVAELAEACDGKRLRHAAVTLGLAAIALWASVQTIPTSHPVLMTSMRWLVAAVFTSGLLVFGFPRLIGENFANKWRNAFRGGAYISGATAVVSLFVMLGLEAYLRTQNGIAGISRPMVIGVGIVLGCLSAMVGAIALFSGPQSNWRERFDLTDRQRVGLVIAAQALASFAWLHIFLCKTHWALLGLRSFWPYIVMVLAFISVGVTEWARRRQDQVMAKTLMQTALYLPLVPVIGFWLSGSLDEWMFRGGRVRYDLLLGIGAVYYVSISALWKNPMSRVAGIVLANAAWWVVLVQQPGWEFLSHPQVWLIPPAACVLVIGHLYRDRINAVTGSAIRYAGTLVIYISSTADMLLQQIGTNVYGPICLILLALLGMAIGVVLRVRPFLYLGAMFVFLGVTSMVWHTHRAVDAMWPWWAFGITTGILLLAGLMAMEKNKPKLRQYANQLATWQG